MLLLDYFFQSQLYLARESVSKHTFFEINVS